MDEQRFKKDEFFKHSPYSPLSPEQQNKFSGLTYFDPNPALIFDLMPEEFTEKANIKMQTSTEDTRYYVCWGKIKFTVDGQALELTVYRMPGEDVFFIPFKDSTSNVETYGGGRYLDAAMSADGRLHVDFNNAYNPYCAYAPRWSCVIPPAENQLNVAIRAGEKLPVGEWIDAGHE